MTVLMSPSRPESLNESGKLCNLSASRIVSALVAMGCTLFPPEIMLKLVVTVHPGSVHTCRLYVVLYPDGGLKVGFLLS